MRRFGRFLRGETGAITVEWVVLTAAVTALAMAIGSYLDGSVASQLKQKLDASLSSGSNEGQ